MHPGGRLLDGGVSCHAVASCCGQAQQHAATGDRENPRRSEGRGPPRPAKPSLRERIQQQLHGAQVEAILLFDKWLDEHYRGPDPDVLARVREIIEQNLAFDDELGGLLGMSELFMTGGQRSGKTFLMEAIRGGDRRAARAARAERCGP